MSFSPRSRTWQFIPLILLSIVQFVTAPALLLATEVWVTDQAANTVAVVDADSLEVVARIPAGWKPHNVIFSNDGRLAFVINISSHDITVIEAASRRPIATLPSGKRAHGGAVSPDGARLFVANMMSNEVAVFDMTSLTKVATVPVGGGPTQVAFSPDGKKAFVSNSLDGTLSIIDATSLKVVATVPTGKGSEGVAAADGLRVFQTAPEDNRIFLVNSSTYQVDSILSFGRREPLGMALSREAGILVVTNRESAALSVVDLMTHKETAVIPVGERPELLDLSVDGRLAYVTSRFGRYLQAVDLEAGKVIKTIRFEGEPHGVAVRPSPKPGH